MILWFVLYQITLRRVLDSRSREIMVRSCSGILIWNFRACSNLFLTRNPKKNSPQPPKKKATKQPQPRSLFFISHSLSFMDPSPQKHLQPTSSTSEDLCEAPAEQRFPWNSKRPTSFLYDWLSIGWFLPNLYMGNGWKSPFPSIYKWLALEFQVLEFSQLTCVFLFTEVKWSLRTKRRIFSLTDDPWLVFSCLSLFQRVRFGHHYNMCWNNIKEPGFSISVGWWPDPNPNEPKFGQRVDFLDFLTFPLYIPSILLMAEIRLTSW